VRTEVQGQEAGSVQRLPACVPEEVTPFVYVENGVGPLVSTLFSFVV